MNKKNKFILIIVFLVTLTAFLIYKCTFINKDVYNMLVKQSSTYMNYYDICENNKYNLDAYILYALTYSYNENNKSELTNLEIKNILESIFNKKFNEDEINNIGITPLLFDNDIMYDYDKKTYYINLNNFQQSKMANKEIIIYDIKNITKKFNKYEILYVKYSIKDPYDILNYYNEKNKDTSKAVKYLSKDGKIKNIKELIDKDYLKSKAKEIENIKIEYIFNDTKFLLNKINYEKS